MGGEGSNAFFRASLRSGSSRRTKEEQRQSSKWTPTEGPGGANGPLRLVVVGGGWWLVIGGGDWQWLAVGGWLLAAVGSLVAVGGWRLVDPWGGP